MVSNKCACTASLVARATCRQSRRGAVLQAVHLWTGLQTVYRNTPVLLLIESIALPVALAAVKIHCSAHRSVYNSLHSCHRFRSTNLVQFTLLCFWEGV